MGPARKIAGNDCGKQRQGNLDDELRAGILCALIRKKSQEVFAVPMIRDPCARTTELYDAAIAAESLSGPGRRDPRPPSKQACGIAGQPGIRSLLPFRVLPSLRTSRRREPVGPP